MTLFRKTSALTSEKTHCTKCRQWIYKDLAKKTDNKCASCFGLARKMWLEKLRRGKELESLQTKGHL